MNRNDVSRFALAPTIHTQRSRYERPSTIKLSFNVGECIPFYWDSVLPGMSCKIDTSKVVRMQTLKTPMLDDIKLDTYYFFVPSRLLWSHWKNFMGENTDSAWIPQNEYTIPQITAPDGGFAVGTVADYLGIPPLVPGLSVNALPFRAYALIMEEWFRSEAILDPLVIEYGDSTVVGSNGSNYITDVAKGGKPFIAAKRFDFFTGALPSPQKGESVQVPLADGALDVYTIGQPNEHYAPLFNKSHSWDAAGKSLTDYLTQVGKGYPLYFQTPVSNSDQKTAFPNIGSVVENGTSGQMGYMSANDKVVYLTSPDSGVHPFLNMPAGSIEFTGNDFQAQVPVNLVASPTSAYTTINELRTAFQIQRFLERDARSGSRYIEVIKAHFSVTNPDYRLQRPEYLGGNSLPINIRQITQTSSTTENQPLGDVAGMSVTTDLHYDFDKSFTEHGYIMGIMVARYDHTYQQGLDKEFLRKTRYDYFWPIFSGLGEQYITNDMLYAQGSNGQTVDPVSGEILRDIDKEVFGYQEAWAEYRYKPNRVAGLMRSVSNSGLDSWHLADDYDSLPTLSPEWLCEDKANVDRVLQVSSAVSDQLFADVRIDNITVSPVPLYSVPGLIDHF